MKKIKLLVLSESEINIVKNELSNIEIVEDNDLVAPVHIDIASNARHFNFS